MLAEWNGWSRPAREVCFIRHGGIEGLLASDLQPPGADFQGGYWDRRKADQGSVAEGI